MIAKLILVHREQENCFKIYKPYVQQLVEFFGFEIGKKGENASEDWCYVYIYIYSHNLYCPTNSARNIKAIAKMAFCLQIAAHCNNCFQVSKRISTELHVPRTITNLFL